MRYNINTKQHSILSLLKKVWKEEFLSFLNSVFVHLFLPGKMACSYHNCGLNTNSIPLVTQEQME